MSAFSRAAALTAVMVALGLAGCANEPEPSVDEFAQLAGHGVDMDYEPLENADDAARRSDLIVVGRMVNIVAGITVRYDDPAFTARHANMYATFVIDVEDVIKGNATIGDEVYVVVPKNTAVGPDQLAARMPQARVALVLEDITGWTPHRTAVVERPSAAPGDARLFYAFTDGFWLQGASDTKMVGLFSSPSELAAGWNGAHTINDFVSQFANG